MKFIRTYFFSMAVFTVLLCIYSYVNVYFTWQGLPPGITLWIFYGALGSVLHILIVVMFLQTTTQSGRMSEFKEECAPTRLFLIVISGPFGLSLLISQLFETSKEMLAAWRALKKFRSPKKQKTKPHTQIGDSRTPYGYPTKDSN